MPGSEEACEQNALQGTAPESTLLRTQGSHFKCPSNFFPKVTLGRKALTSLSVPTATGAVQFTWLWAALSWGNLPWALLPACSEGPPCRAEPLQLAPGPAPICPAAEHHVTTTTRPCARREQRETWTTLPPASVSPLVKEDGHISPAYLMELL